MAAPLMTRSPSSFDATSMSFRRIQWERSSLDGQQSKNLSPSPPIHRVQQGLALLMNDQHVVTGAPAEFANYSMKNTKSAAPLSSPPPFDFAPMAEEGDSFPFPVMDNPFVVVDSGSSEQDRRKSLFISTLASSTSTTCSDAVPPLTPAGPSPSTKSDCLPTPTDAVYRCFEPTQIVCDSPESIDDKERPNYLVESDAPASAITLTEKYLTKHSLLFEFTQQYSIQAELGTGGFGFVVRAVRLYDSVEVAVKFIIKANMPEHMWRTDARWRNGRFPLPSEALFLMDLRHDSIVEFIDLMEDANFFYLIMEHHGSPWSGQPKGAPHSTTSPGYFDQPNSSPTRRPPVGPSKLLPVPPPFIRRSSCDLFECIESRSRLSETEARYVFTQILCAVRYLHRQGVYHMDMKDENVVIDAQLKVKIIDFGSAVKCSPNHVFKRFFGTVAYAAPEILKHRPYLAGPAEIWALGIIFSILLIGESLYRRPEDVLEMRYNQPAFEALGPRSQRILCLCLEANPANRVDIETLCNDPWLQPAVEEIERSHIRRHHRRSNVSMSSPLKGRTREF